LLQDQERLEQNLNNPVSWLVFEPRKEPAGEPRDLGTGGDGEPAEQPAPGVVWFNDTLAQQIVRSTRSWIQYGMVGFTVVCIVIGAVEGLLGR
jgi:hypothetical protein